MINAYSLICSLGSDPKNVFENALYGGDFLSKRSDIIKNSEFFFGEIKEELPPIQEEKYNTRCNRILLYSFYKIENEIKEAIKKYGKNRVGVIVSTTNSGINEYELSGDIKQTEIGNPAEFLHNFLGLENIYMGVSTACSSGVKAFLSAKKLIDNNVCDCVLTGASDALSTMPSYGFNSLEVLSNEPCIPFSAKRKGINLGEGGSLFLIEREEKENSIYILGGGETSDAYHCATPEPTGKEASRAIENALKMAHLSPEDIDYINLHGTGTISNDLMEANAVSRVFKDRVLSSSTKHLTGHCLGASAGVEAALCCILLDRKINKENKVYPNKEEVIDPSLSKINLAKKGDRAQKLNYVLNNAFGFGGTNAVLILGNKNGKI